MRRYLNIGLALLALGWLVFSGVRFYTAPHYGLLLGVGGEVIEVAPGSVARPGDRLISVNDRAFLGLAAPQDVIQVAGRGEPLRLVLQRGGERLEAVQPAVPRPTLHVVLMIAATLVALVFLAVGVLVALGQPGKAGQLFWLFCLSIAVVLGHPGSRSGLEFVLHSAAEILAPAFLLHFFLFFPHRHPVAKRFRWLGSSLYMPPLAFLGLLLGLAIASSVSIVPGVFVEGVAKGTNFFALAYFLWAVLTFADSYRRLEDPLERERLRWVFWGVVVSILPIVAVLGVRLLLGVPVPFFEIGGLVLLPILPISFAYAILAHRLMDVEIVLNRGLVYSAITVLLVGVFIVVEDLLALLSLELTGQSSFALALGAAVVMAALVNPVKSRIQLFVDRLFFAYKAKLREGLKDLAEELSFITDLERMETLLLRRLTVLAHVSRAALFLREEGGEGYRLVEAVGVPEWRRVDGDEATATVGVWSRGGVPGSGEPSLADGGPRFEANDSFVIWLLRKASPLSLESLPAAEFEQRVERGEVEILRTLDAALALPLRLRADLIGFLLLSRRRNRELFNRDEIDLLQNLAIKAAADLTNARLQTKSRRLEAEVVALREELLAGLRGFLGHGGTPPSAAVLPRELPLPPSPVPPVAG